MSSHAGGRLRWAAIALPCFVLALLLGAGHAWAQRNSPFGVTQPEANLPGLANPFFAWIYVQTAEFNRQINTLVVEAKRHGTLGWGLITASFIYGVFHAAGPGHGKAVISSYLFANDEAVKKGVMLSFAFALVQAVSAVVIVTVLTAFFNATAAVMDNTTLALERLSNLMVMAIGAWLLWRKGGALWGLVAARYGLPGGHVHVHGADCGHFAMPPDTAAARRNSIRAILLASLRPCTGALVVLVLAWKLDVYGVGIASTFVMGLGTACTIAAIALVAVTAKGLAVRLAAPESFGAAVAVRSLETCLALAVFSLGLGLLLLSTIITMPGF
ncbi:nickel/cobalt transporter [Labrys monachus]|uniref:Nickel/cobalt efflux system n=1 Tax=Labrys monachus TaxID=217067 RepID=A0ABU0FAS2_9HYPH|nr:nickel/cobalt transporter [Labrys monachus]MDQ0391717.1 ABC-type nickel/cobalt efflux system permease component RcnA [Labrys monachus]